MFLITYGHLSLRLALSSPCPHLTSRFLFIVGLELDPGLFRSNAKKAGILSITGQAVTWVLSLGVSQAMMAW